MPKNNTENDSVNNITDNDFKDYEFDEKKNEMLE